MEQSNNHTMGLLKLLRPVNKVTTCFQMTNFVHAKDTHTHVGMICTQKGQEYILHAIILARCFPLSS